MKLVSQFLKDRNENFDEYYNYIQNECILLYVRIRIQLYFNIY